MEFKCIIFLGILVYLLAIARNSQCSAEEVGDDEALVSDDEEGSTPEEHYTTEAVTSTDGNVTLIFKKSSLDQVQTVPPPTTVTAATTTTKQLEFLTAQSEKSNPTMGNGHIYEDTSDDDDYDIYGDYDTNELPTTTAKVPMRSRSGLQKVEHKPVDPVDVSTIPQENKVAVEEDASLETFLIVGTVAIVACVLLSVYISICVTMNRLAVQTSRQGNKTPKKDIEKPESDDDNDDEEEDEHEMRDSSGPPAGAHVLNEISEGKREEEEQTEGAGDESQIAVKENAVVTNENKAEGVGTVEEPKSGESEKSEETAEPTKNEYQETDPSSFWLKSDNNDEAEEGGSSGNAEKKIEQNQQSGTEGKRDNTIETPKEDSVVPI